MIGRFAPFLLGIFVLVTDLLSKFLINGYLPLSAFQSHRYPYGGIGVFQDFFGIEFSIIHQTNRGAAWGMLAEWQNYLMVLRLLLICALLIYILFFNQRKSWNFPFALIISGALGNVIDYFLYGHVVDMWHFVFWGYEYPTFNIADSAIFIGIFWLLFLSWNDKHVSNKVSL